MGISVGGINLGLEIVNTEQRVGVLERLVEELMNNRPVSPQKLEQIKDEVMRDLQKKFPNAGIEKK